MTQWTFPAGNHDYLDLIARLPVDPGPGPRNQHVVSRTILQGFATPMGNGRGWTLTPFDVSRGRVLRPRGLKGCAYVKDFVMYAAHSAELTWKSVEDQLPAAVAAARAKVLHSDRNAQLRDVITGAIALHIVRTPRLLREHLRLTQLATSKVRTRTLIERKTMLNNEFIRQYGLVPAGPQALEVVLDNAMSPWREAIESGALTRVTLESLFRRISGGLQGMAIEVWHVPQGTELLVSDNAAFTFAYTDGGSKIATNMAFGDSNGAALPIAHDCLVAIGATPKDDVLVADQVELFNEVQIRNADKYVYLRPGSRLEMFVQRRLDDGVRSE